MPEHERIRMDENPGMAAKMAAGVVIAGRAAGSGLKNMIQEIGQVRQAKADQKAQKSGSHSAGAHSAGGGMAGLFSRWEDSRWKRVQIAGIALCVVLAIIITGIIISGRKSAAEEAEDATVVPTPETNEVIVYDTADLITDYPDDDTKAEIAAASLSVYPSDEEYVTEETTAKVSASGGLNLRTGPNSSYNQITLMSSGSTVQVYAYKNGWALVKYQGTTWGWCSQDYLS